MSMSAENLRYGGLALDQAAERLIGQVREALTEREALLVASSAPMSVMLRTGDLLRIPDVDFYNEAGLSAEILLLVRTGAL
jgi:hypothetical protein